MRRLVTVKPQRLESIERLICSQQLGQRVILEHVATRGVHTKERTARASALQQHERRPRRSPPILAQHFRERTDRRGLKQSGERQVASQRFFYLCKQTHRQQRMAAQLKKV